LKQAKAYVSGERRGGLLGSVVEVDVLAIGLISRTVHRPVITRELTSNREIMAVPKVHVRETQHTYW
jgi:hypothetical protein